MPRATPAARSSCSRNRAESGEAKLAQCAQSIQALLTSSPQGKTDFLQADLRDPEAIVAGAAATLDFTRPIGVLLIAVLHFIPDTDDPYGSSGSRWTRCHLVAPW